MYRICWHCKECVEEDLLIPLQAYRVCPQCKDYLTQSIKEGVFSLGNEALLGQLIDELEKGRFALLVCNVSRFMTSTGPIEVLIKGETILRLRRKEYCIVPWELGQHTVTVRHKEGLLPIWYTDSYHLDFTKTDCCMEVFTGNCSTGCRLTSKVPDGRSVKRRVEPRTKNFTGPLGPVI